MKIKKKPKKKIRKYSYCNLCKKGGKLSKGLCKKCTHKSDFGSV